VPGDRPRKCKKGCVEACGERNAIQFDQQEVIEEYDVGAIIITTGFKAFDLGDPGTTATAGFPMYTTQFWRSSDC